MSGAPVQQLQHARTPSKHVRPQILPLDRQHMVQHAHHMHPQQVAPLLKQGITADDTQHQGATTVEWKGLRSSAVVYRLGECCKARLCSTTTPVPPIIACHHTHHAGNAMQRHSQPTQCVTHPCKALAHAWVLPFLCKDASQALAMPRPLVCTLAQVQPCPHTAVHPPLTTRRLPLHRMTGITQACSTQSHPSSNTAPVQQQQALDHE